MLATGTAAAQGIAVLASPVITRLYSPSDIGSLASLTAIVTVLGVVSAGRYDLAIVLPENDEEALSVATVGSMIAGGLGTLTFVFFLFFGQKMTPFVGLGTIHWVWPLFIGPIVCFLGLQHVFQRLLLRHRRFRGIATTQVVQQVGTAAAKVGIGIGPAGVGGLVVATLFGHVARLSGLVLSARDVVRSNWKSVSWASLKMQAYRYRKFPMVSTWSGFLNSASTELPVILFASVFSPSVAGYYALSHRILKLPMGLIGQNVGQVFLERAARARMNKPELSRLTKALYGRMLIIGTIILSFVTFYGDLLFPFVFGDSWAEAGRYGQWISIWLIFVFASSPLSSLFSILEHQGEGVIWNGLLLASRMAVIFSVPYVADGALPVIAAYALVGASVWFAQSLRLLVLSGGTLADGVVVTVRSVFPVLAIQYVVSIAVRRWVS